MFNLSDKTCLVTGGAGFIGSHLVDLLLANGCRVRVLDNLANGKKSNLAAHVDNVDFSFILGSITDQQTVAEAVSGVDIIFHLACLGVRHSIAHPYENHQVNAEGTLRLLEAARQLKVARFLYCSSSEVYGTAEYVPMPESHSTRPCTVYGGSKLAGESYARAYSITYGLPVTIIRPFNTYGPRSHHEGDAGEMIPKSIVRVLNSKNILVFGDGSQTRDFTYVTDTARGLVTAIEYDDFIGRTLNIGSNFEISIKELAEKIIAMGPNNVSKVEHTPDRPGDVGRLYADPSRFMEICDWQPQVGFDSGLRKTFDFFKNHPDGLSSLIGSEQARNW